jgi:Flp pilus assembly protein TadG
MGRLLRNAHAAAAAAAQQVSQQQAKQQQQASPANGHQAATADGAAQASGNDTTTTTTSSDWYHIPLPPLPPVYNNCSVLVREEGERRCRDLYVEVVLTDLTEPGHAEEAREKLQEACKLNPHVVSRGLHT